MLKKFPGSFFSFFMRNIVYVSFEDITVRPSNNIATGYSFNNRMQILYRLKITFGLFSAVLGSKNLKGYNIYLPFAAILKDATILIEMIRLRHCILQIVQTAKSIYSTRVAMSIVTQQRLINSPLNLNKMTDPRKAAEEAARKAREAAEEARRRAREAEEAARKARR